MRLPHLILFVVSVSTIILGAYLNHDHLGKRESLNLKNTIPTRSQGSKHSPSIQERPTHTRRNADGTVSELKRINENVITKRTLKEIVNGERVLISRTIYLMDFQGRPRSSKIFDAKGKELFKIRYGYSKESDRLLAESVFTSQANKTDDQVLSLPILHLYHQYDAKGRRRLPVYSRIANGKNAPSIQQRMKKYNIIHKENGSTIDHKLVKILTPQHPSF